MIEISTKTGTGEYADSGDSVTAILCNGSGECCSVQLDHPNDDVRQIGSLDVFSGFEELGQCSKITLDETGLKLTVKKTEDDSTDGWKVDWVKVKVNQGITFTCPFNGYIDNDDGAPRERTVQCQNDMRGKKIYFKSHFPSMLFSKVM